MKSLTHDLLKRFIKLASSELEGEWVLVGGTVLFYLDQSYRSTTDIDFIPLGSSSNSQSLKIMEICERLELPVETVNGAAAIFFNRIKNRSEHLVEIYSAKARIYIPDAYLYVRLKIGRMSGTDLTDALKMIQLRPGEIAKKDARDLMEMIRELMLKAEPQKLSRYVELLGVLGAY